MPMTLLITTIWPRFLLFMSGRTSFSNRTSPKKLVSITVFISSMDWHSMGPIRPIPALLTVRGSQAWREIIQRHLKSSRYVQGEHALTGEPILKENCDCRLCETNCVHWLRMSTLRSGRLSTQALMESSSQTSNCLISKVLPRVRPAASTSASPLLRFLMVA